MNEIIGTITELASLIGAVIFVITNQDIRLIVLTCTVYIASVIRHSRKEK